MLARKATQELENWKAHSSHKALLVTGARQVGKTYLVRNFAKENYEHIIEINLLEIEGAAEAFSAAVSSNDLFSRITLFANDQLIPHKTLIFIDEVQEAPEMITAAKFLVDKTGDKFDYIFSGSMLGVELKGIKSWPVGYLREIAMYPLDFEEFCWANGLAASITVPLYENAAERQPVDEFVHKRLMSLFFYYLAVGGMPEAVAIYVDTSDLARVRSVQKDIVQAYRHDIAKYCKDDALFVKSIFDGIPAQLNQQNKRYTATSLGKNVRITRSENKFLWLVEANVAHAVYNVREPRYPLQLAKDASFFKLFMSDVGLLAWSCGMETVRKTILKEPTNYGSIYENYVAQELVAHGFDLFYFKNKRMGELDFVVENSQGAVLPLEVKSGKDYQRHSALNNVLRVQDYSLKEAIVLCNDNVKQVGQQSYLPIYLAGFLRKDTL